MADVTSIPLVPLANLPKYSGSASGTLDIVAVTPEGNTVRCDWNTLTTHFVQVQVEPHTPTDEGVEGAISIADSIYTYFDGKWGKTPRYTGHWDDISDSTRFLCVNEVMDLSEKETSNLREMAGISTASNTELGIVKGSDSVVIAADGTMTVPEATPTVPGITFVSGVGPVATVEYVDIAVARIPTPTVTPATETTLGGILASDTVRVGATGVATVPASVPGEDSPGLTRVAPLTGYDSTTHAAWAAPVTLVEQIALDTVTSNVPAATEASRGTVQPSGAIYIKPGTTGVIDTYTANTERYGVVKTTDAIPEIIPTTEGLVPSLLAVKNYVDAGAGTRIDPSNLPVATGATLGAIISSDTVRVTAAGTNAGQAYVPTATASSYGVVRVTTGTSDTAPAVVTSKAYVDQAITKATAGIQSAAVTEARAIRPTETVYGLVRVTASSSDTSSSMAVVPTTKYMQDYVAQAVAGVTWNGGTVTGVSTFSGGLRTPHVSSPLSTSVLNYAQLQTLFAAK